MSTITPLAGETSAVLDALRQKLWTAAVARAIESGTRDSNQLTNMVFFARHPELGGRKLRPDERGLASEWVSIRETLVRPALRTASTAEPGATTQTSAPDRPPIPASRLEWPGATAAQLAFMRAVYEQHFERAKRGDRPYVANLPDGVLDPIEDSHRARKDTARAARALLAAARAALAAEGLAAKVEIGIVSAYRPAEHQFAIWQGKGRSGGFPHYYAETRAARRRLGDEHGREAVEHLAEQIGRKIAAPGFSNHQDGLAIDFGTRAAGKGGFGKIGARSWFHRWLKANAARFGFHAYPEETWHWTHRAPAGSVQQETLEDSAPAAGIRAAKLRVPRVPLLAGHRGKPPDLVLEWNDMRSKPEELDVVVHLHGYSRAGMTLPDDIERWSGLDLAPVDGASGRGRTRPTLTVLPRAHFTGEQRGKLYKYTFPALLGKGALMELVRFALEQFARAVGGDPPRLGRLVLTAHSGGGAPLLRILREQDPHEVHVFDGLYQHAGQLAKWARERITHDRAAAPGRASGALRVFYRSGTRKFSSMLRDELAKELAAAPEDVRRRYRVEASTYGHWQIPRQYGWRILADAAADVPNARSEGAARHELPGVPDLELVADYEDVAESETESETAAEDFLAALPTVSRIYDALRQKLWPLAVAAAIASGKRDENELTNMVFFARHPELGGRKLRPDERELAKEWLAIRDQLVRPALVSPPSAASPDVTAPAPVGVPTRAFGTLSAQLSGAAPFSYRFTPNDALWLARFIKGEAGGRDDAENRAVIWAMFNRYALFTHPESHFGKRAGVRAYPTFASFIRRYSTTLQPYLMSAGAVERAKKYDREGTHKWVPLGGTFTDSKGRVIEKGQLEKHLRLQQLAWTSPELDTARRLAEAALTGQVANPIGLASNFADTVAYYRQHFPKPPGWKRGDPGWPSESQWRDYTNAHEANKWAWIGPRADLRQYGTNAFFVDRRLLDLHRGNLEVVRVLPPA